MSETVSYTTSQGTVLNLKSTTYTCSPKDSKVFQYNEEGGCFTVRSKSFSLTVIAVGDSNANALVDTIIDDVQTNSYGVLEINDWKLRCKCFGVTGIEAEGNGVVSVQLSFYTDRFLWFKDVQKTLTTTFSYTALYPFAISFNCASVTGNTEFNVGSYVYKVTDSSSTAYACVSDYHNKTIRNGSTSLIGKVPDACDWFRTIPKGTYNFEKVGETFTSATIKIHLFRGMPEW